jgi:hypothetical protein
VRYFVCPEKSGLFVKRLQVKLDKDFPQEKRSDVPSKPTSRLPSFEEKKVVAEPIPAAAKTSIEEAVAAPAPIVAAPAPIVAAPVISSAPVVRADPVIPRVPSPPSTIPAPPLPSSITSQPEALPSDHEDQIAILRNSLNQKSVELEQAQQSHTREVHQLQEQIHQLENENLSHRTACATSGADKDLSEAQLKEIQKQNQEMILLKDQTIGSFEQRVSELSSQLEEERKNSSREIAQLKQMLEQDKQAENSDQQRWFVLLPFFRLIPVFSLSLLLSVSVSLCLS